MSKGKKVYIRTLGCQMNVRDSEVVSGLLSAKCYTLTTNLDKADAILFNTCSVRQHAEDKVWSEIGAISKRYARNTKRSSKPIIGIIGCMAQNYKQDIFKRSPRVDIVCGTNDIHKLPDMIKKSLAKSRESRVESKFIKVDSKFRCEDVYKTNFYQDKDHVFVVISEGCDNFCSYCVVPYVRGRLRHRKAKHIIDEIKRHVDYGISKITLLGQNVNAYKSVLRSKSSDLTKSKINFVELVRIISEIRGVKELSFITSHPKDIDANLFKLMNDKDNIKKYLHLPVQSGSDRILKLMKRGYSFCKYINRKT